MKNTVRVVAMAGLVLLGTIHPCKAELSRAKIFVGKIVTVDDHNTIAEAVEVNQYGQIVKIGTAAELTAHNPLLVEVITLKPGHVLMPGFIEPHMHLVGTFATAVPEIPNLAPPLAPNYAAYNAPGCQRYIRDVLKNQLIPSNAVPGSATNHFLAGINLDPSRQPWDETTSSTNFMANPAQYIQSALQSVHGHDWSAYPVFMEDQSGHLGYVNQAAFNAVEAYYASKHWTYPPTNMGPGAVWVTNSAGAFTGLLQEEGAMEPFMHTFSSLAYAPLSIIKTDPIKLLSDLASVPARTFWQLRNAGFTTVVDTDLSKSQYDTSVAFARRYPDLPIRIANVVATAVANPGGGVPMLEPVGPGADPTTNATCVLPRWLGLGAVKMWVDGSTQGGTAWLEDPFYYLDDGHCAGKGYGRPNYPDVQAMIDEFYPLWITGKWRFDIHANGNRAVNWTAQMIGELQAIYSNPHPTLVIHATPTFATGG